MYVSTYTQVHIQIEILNEKLLFVSLILFLYFIFLLIFMIIK